MSKIAGLRLCRLLPLLMALCLVAALPGPAKAQTARVAILTFTANSPKDISYLTRGIRDMLASRLAWEGKVQVVEPDMVERAAKDVKPPYNDQKAREIGKKLGADVVVFGAVTMLGKTLSIDARVVRTGSDAPALTTYVQAPSEDEVIPKINAFAQRINAEIFRRPEAIEAQKRADAAEKAASGQGGGMSDEAAQIAKSDDPHMSPLNPLFMKSLYGVTSDRYWRSPRIHGSINAMTVADIDLDGHQEVVIVTRDTLRVYRHSGEYFQLVTEFKDAPLGALFYSVDAGDLDGDGRPEIYVSARNAHSLISFVLIYRDRHFEYLDKGITYYLRMQDNPWGKGKVLFGQQTAPNAPFFGPVYRMKWQGGSLKAAEEVTLPDMYTIFNFALADLTGSGGRPMCVLSGNTYHMRVYDRKMSQVWQSEDMYNASDLFVYFRKISGGAEDDDVWYMHTRMLVVDLDNDGRKEIIAVRNSDPMGMMLGRMRMFNRGQLFCLQWNGMSMSELWRTPRISGYVADYAVADVADTGQPALVLAYNLREYGGLVDKGFSYIVAYTIRPQSAADKARQQR